MRAATRTAALAPTDLEVVRLLAAVRRRIVRLVARHGIDLEDASHDNEPEDERLFEWPAYAAIQGAAVLGRVATGPRAGGRDVHVGRDPTAPMVRSTCGAAARAPPRRGPQRPGSQHSADRPPAPSTGAPLQAESEGFDLHAGVATGGAANGGE